MSAQSAETASRRDSDSALIVSLLGDALVLIDRDQASARERIEQACRLVAAAAEPPAPRGGLAPWQAHRVAAHIDAGLAGGLRMDEAAAVVRLSASYFSRAFKTTFGVAYSAYVLAKRMERAKRLLITTDDPISGIALACGLADQSHLTRLFSRSVGLPPHAWRRLMRERPSVAA